MRSEHLYLEDIVAACDAIEIFVAGISQDTFLSTDLINSAVVKKFEIIGEASARLSEETRIAHSEIDWSALIGFRNILIHQYFSSDLEIVWEAATNRVGELKEHVEAIIRFRYPAEKSK